MPMIRIMDEFQTTKYKRFKFERISTTNEFLLTLFVHCKCEINWGRKNENGFFLSIIWDRIWFRSNELMPLFHLDMDTDTLVWQHIYRFISLNWFKSFEKKKTSLQHDISKASWKLTYKYVCLALMYVKMLCRKIDSVCFLFDCLFVVANGIVRQ